VWLDDGNGDGVRRIRLRAAKPILEILERCGEVPLPPYIERRPSEEDAAAYQTVYARAPGAVAAPTAGLHFTDEILTELAAAGIEIVSLTLHVGAGTFLPLRGEEVDGQSLPAEPVEIPAETAEAVVRAKREGRRVIAVGTTTVRALEGGLSDLETGARREDVALLIAPGFHFRVVDGLITNFHLPRSTLLMLVAAFAGKDFVLDAYREAVAQGYRFYSYGDAMLIL
jgi:S-adenosylmethionine:tRNA ribosyltransferase-isomerase